MHRPARHPRRPSRSPIGGAGHVRIVASIAAFLLVLAAAAPAWASAGPTKLFDPVVSPRSGTPNTTIVVTVSYRNREGTPRPSRSPAPVAGRSTEPGGPIPSAFPWPTGASTPVADPTATTSPTPSDDDLAVVPGGVVDPWNGGPAAPNGNRGGGGSDQGSDGGSWAALAAGLELLTGGRPTVPLGLVATLVTTSGVVGATLAFGLFGKRRRDGDPPAPDDVLAHNAASPLAVAAAAGYVGDIAQGDLRDPIAGGVKVANPMDAELALPRWRRPSLLEARKADPIRDAVEVPRLTFDHGLVGPIDGRERRLIRYNLVRLLDMPDELRGTELAFLDQGDEVQLLEKRGAYWLVLCPDGLQGWIHKMTLGDLIGDPPVQSTPTATMPIAADTWTMGDDVDGDVLAAYLESRRRA